MIYLQRCQIDLVLFEQVRDITIGSFKNLLVKALATLGEFLELEDNEPNIVDFILHRAQPLG